MTFERYLNILACNFNCYVLSTNNIINDHEIFINPADCVAVLSDAREIFWQLFLDRHVIKLGDKSTR